MSALAKLNLKTIHRVVNKDPVTMRREKLVAGIEEQQRVLEAALRGEAYTVATTRKTKNDAGEVVKEQAERRVRAWFFEQDAGYYLQCRYGARILFLNGKNNAVWVEKLDEVAGVLETFKQAALAGELDRAVALVMAKRS
jgi:RecG-like helicase